MMRVGLEARLRGALLVAAAFAGCTELESASDRFAATGAGSAPTAGRGGEAGNDEPALPSAGEGGAPSSPGGAGGGAGSCPPLAEREEVRLSEAPGVERLLEEDTTFDCRYRYELEGPLVVGYGVTLRIEPGTVLAAEPGALILSARGGRIEAVGTEDEPIVITSGKPEGSRAPGDYRGVVLIGDGPSHTTNVAVPDTLADSRAHFGGGPLGSPGASCGVLRYVRIEFAGGDPESEQPGAALTLAGCGSGTEVDHVQIHRATDGLGVIGGTADLRHVLISRNSIGNALEWTGGYRGTLAFLIAQSLGASAALVGSNSEAEPDREPRSRARIYNATLVGSAPLVPVAHYGLSVRDGSRVAFKNSIIQGFSNAAIDLDLPTEVLSTDIGPDKPVDISHVSFHANSEVYTSSAEVLATAEGMLFEDPGLPAAASATMPDFRPNAASVTEQVAGPVPPFDPEARFRGAVAPEGSAWTLGWTAFPPD